MILTFITSIFTGIGIGVAAYLVSSACIRQAIKFRNAARERHDRDARVLGLLEAINQKLTHKP